MRDDALVLAEWRDAWIPPRRHMAVMSVGDALAGVEKGYVIFIHPLDPELFKDERAPAQRRI